MPLLSVVKIRVLTAALQSSFAAHTLEKFHRARPQPILPVVDIAVVNRIVMDIIDAGPKVPMRFDHAIEAVEPNLSAALIFFAIPIEGCAPVQPPQLVSQRFD